MKTFQKIFYCKQLEDIHLKNATTFSRRDLEMILNILQLKTLKIEKAIRLQNEDILNVFCSETLILKYLISFTLTQCYKLEDSGLYAILKMCGANLIHLNIEGCSKLTKISSVIIINYCHNLKFLNVAFTEICANLKFYKTVPNNFPDLEVLIVDNFVEHNELTNLLNIMNKLKIIISDCKFLKSYIKFIKQDK